MIEFKLPSLGSDMDEGKLLEWKVKPGEVVKRGDIVAVVDTTKAAVDVESWQEGTMHQQLVAVGETVPVGTVIATFLEQGESPPPAGAAPARKAPPEPTAPAAPPAPSLATAPSPATAPTAQAAAPSSRKAVSPAARARAKELSLDVEAVAGTGPQGAVTVEDVEKAAAIGKPSVDRASEMRKAIAAAMGRSKREIPHYYLAETIPMARAAEWLARENEKRPVTARLLMGVLQVKAVALALAKAPELNGFWREGAFEPGKGVHVGVAISMRQGGLVAPAIHDVDKKTLDELMRDLRGPRGPRALRLPQELGDVRSHDHRHQPGRVGCGSGVRRDLSTAGGAGGLRARFRAAVERGRHGSRNAARHREPRRRPPRERRHARRALPRGAPRAAPTSGGTVNDTEIKALVVAIIRTVAPEVEEGELRADRALRDQVDLDSMDWLNVIIGVHEKLHVDIPEADYGKLRTLDDWAAYLRGKA